MEVYNKSMYRIILYGIIGFSIFFNSCLQEKNESEKLFTELENENENEKPFIDRISIKYSHSLRIPHQQIICTLYEDTRNFGSYKMDIETIAMIYQDPYWNLEDEKTRNYIESDEYINSRIDLINTMEEYSKENIRKTINIEKDFFEKINRAIWEINLRKIIQENDPRVVGINGRILRKSGLDGSDVTIEYGTYQYYISINVWDPKNTGGEVNKINNITLEIFRRAGIDQWYE